MQKGNRTASQVLAQQKADAARGSWAAPAVAPKAPPPAVPDTRTPVQAYLDEIAPSGIVGRMVKFSGKDSGYITPDDGEKIADETDFIALCDQVLVGWQKFNNDAPPDRRMGLLYEGFTPQPQASLPDRDEAGWPTGLSGKPEDPWKHFAYLPLQHGETAELFTLTVSSQTGRRAVGTLLRHFDRMRKSNPGELPVIRLKVGGFQHKDDRIGWVPTPVLAVVGRAPRDSVAKPDTSTGGDMDDAIPF
jgi:hypothetical protein